MKNSIIILALLGSSLDKHSAVKSKTIKSVLNLEHFKRLSILNSLIESHHTNGEAGETDSSDSDSDSEEDQ